MTAFTLGSGLMTVGCCAVLAIVVLTYMQMFRGELPPRLASVYRWGLRLLPATSGVIMLGGVLDQDWSAAMGATAALLLWWRLGGGNGMRRLLDQLRDVVTRSGNRLAVKQV